MLFGNNNRSKNLDSMYYNQLPSSIRVQLEALKSLDIYTKKHIEEVPKYVYKICNELGVTNEKLNFIVISAYLHDVGKIFVPSKILQKNGKLTDEEYEIMKSHSEKGYEICMSLDDIRPYASTVKAHHESLDGSGYPDGLVGTQMTYEARIIKVADVYSALSSKRQYKEAFSTQKIMEIMYKDVENHKMDGKVVYALFKVLIKEKIDTLNELKHSMGLYKKQLKYSQNIFRELEHYAKQQLNSYEVMKNLKYDEYLYDFINIDIKNIIDANELYSALQTNMKLFSSNIDKYSNIKNEIKELKKYCNKIKDRI